MATPTPELIQLVREGVPNAFETLLKMSEGLIKRLISKHIRLQSTTDRDECDQVARIALLHAAAKWEVSLGTWPQYASAVILQEIRWHLWGEARQALPTDSGEIEQPVPESLPPPALADTPDGSLVHLSETTAYLVIGKTWHLCMIAPERYFLWEVGPQPVRLTIEQTRGRMLCTCQLGSRGRQCEHTRTIRQAFQLEEAKVSEIKQRSLRAILESFGGTATVRQIRQKCRKKWPTVQSVMDAAEAMESREELRIEYTRAGGPGRRSTLLVLQKIAIGAE